LLAKDALVVVFLKNQKVRYIAKLTPRSRPAICLAVPTTNLTCRRRSFTFTSSPSFHHELKDVYQLLIPVMLAELLHVGKTFGQRLSSPPLGVMVRGGTVAHRG
jgi:hypothetical protein